MSATSLARRARDRSVTHHIARRPVFLVSIVVVVAVVHQIADAPGLTSSSGIGASVRLAVPILLAGLGALWAERAGVLNLGLEGMMIVGAWSAAWVGATHGPWAGVLAGILGGVIAGLVHAVATVTFGVDQVISGVAINLLAPGLARYLSVVAWSDKPGAGATQSPAVTGDIPTFTAPLLAGGDLGSTGTPDWLGVVERGQWFLVSDVCGILRGLLVDVSVLTAVAFSLAIVTWICLWQTAFGLRLRFVGENPSAADSLGVPVYRMKYVAVLVSGGFAGMAGAFLVTVASGIYREGQTGGRGFIGLAAMIFGNWRPGGTTGGALLFGYTDALQLRDDTSVRALILVLGIALIVLAARVAVSGRHRTGASLLAAGAAAVVGYLLAEEIPAQLVYATPYVVTLVVLVAAARRLRMPAANGLAYRRGEGDR